MENTFRILLYDSSADKELIGKLSASFPDARLFHAETKESFEEGIECFKPDIVLAEYPTPGYEGTEALQYVFSKAPMRTFLYLTETLDDKAAERCMRDGAWNVIEKSRYWRLEMAIQRCDRQTALFHKHQNILEELRESEARYRNILDVSPIAIAIHADGIVRYINPVGARLLGAASQEEVIGLPVSRFVPQDSLDAALDRLNRLAAGEEGLYPVEDVYLRLDGKPRQVEIMGTLLKYQNQRAVQVIIKDITDQKKSEEYYKYLSYHDHMTGLCNRRFFEEELTRDDTAANLPITVVIGDVNGLKHVNDTRGHDAGDRIILKSAEAIRKGCRENDIVARIGGDEFAVLLPRTDSRTARRVIARIIRCARDAGTDDGQCLSISLGYATKTSADQSITDIQARAENNMYKSKRVRNHG